jgi:hypothetical protein
VLRRPLESAHDAAVKMVKMQGSVFGAVSTARAFVEALP